MLRPALQCHNAKQANYELCKKVCLHMIPSIQGKHFSLFMSERQT